MKRRVLLTSLGLAATSGCLSGTNDSGTATSTTNSESTSSSTATVSPSPTPRPSIPRIQNLNLLSYWEEYGDVLENKMTAVGKGANANIGLRYILPVHKGKSEELVQATIYHEGKSVDSRKVIDTQLSGEKMAEDSWERWFSFDTKGLETGQYTVEAIVRDEISGRNSSPRKSTFEVIDPLRSDEVELTRIEKPPNIKKGDSISFTLRLKNVSEQDNSVVSRLSARFENNEWQTSEQEKFKLNIPAGETRKWESAEFVVEYTGTYEYQLNAVDATWNITVSD